jgi:DNA-binding transcriptional LysR family regulator
MDTFDKLRSFAAVVEADSFTAAADRLSLTPQLVSKYVKSLENDLGARLLNRTTRRVALTDTGRAFHPRCLRLIEDYEEMRSVVGAIQAQPKGHLVIAGPMTFGELYLVEALRDFTAAYSEVTVELKLTDRFVNLIDENVDLAIRIGQLEDSNLIARKLGAAPIVCCAAPSYLAHAGAPSSPSNLHEHECIIDTNFRNSERWRFREGEETYFVPVRSQFRVNSAIAVQKLVVSGAGIALCPEYVVRDDLRSGRLTELFSGKLDYDLNIFAVYLENRHLSAKVRSFIDFMSARYKSTY